MTPSPSGQVRPPHQIALSRTFRAPVADVWASVTEPGRLSRWWGTWTGDPTTGQVIATMTAEPDAEPQPVEIRTCAPPRLLSLRFVVGEDDWLLDLELRETGEATELTLVQTFAAPDGVADIGPGWEYYLDRLVAAESGGDPEAVDFFADYHPAMQPYYADLADRLFPPQG
jgi:uncharacterized protein YndB with AHSA1/START domain